MFKCEKCKREFSRKANLDWHEKYCDGSGKKKVAYKKKSERMEEEKEEKKEVKTKIECKKSDDGQHDLIVLRPINRIQLVAMKSGYTAYCRICKTLV